MFTRKSFGIGSSTITKPEVLEQRALLSIMSPLARIEPHGSFLFEATEVGNISSGVDEDDFTIQLQSGDVVSVVVDPDSGLAPHLELLDPTLSVATSDTTALGVDAVVQSYTIDQTGTWTISVSPDSGTGDYGVRLLVGGAIEATDSANGTELAIDNARLELAEGRWSVVGVSSSGGDIDEYTIDLTGKSSSEISVMLAGRDGTDFSTATLELLDTDGTTVLATGSASPLTQAAENYDQGILDFDVPADGVYTIRLNASVDSEYAISVVENSAIDSEANNTPDDNLVSLDGRDSAVGHLGTGNRVFGLVADNDEIVEYNAVTGDELNRFDLPALSGGEEFSGGMAFNGQSIYVTTTAPNLYEIDADTGTVLSIHSFSSLSITITEPEIGDLGFVAGYLAVSHLGTNEVSFIDTISWTVAGSWEAGAQLLPGLAGAGSRGSVFMTFYNEINNRQIGEFNAANGDLIQSIDVPFLVSEIDDIHSPHAFGTNLAFAGGQLFVSGQGIGAFPPVPSESITLVIDPDTGDLLDMYENDDVVALGGDEAGGHVSSFSQGIIGNPSIPTVSETESNSTLLTADAVNVGTLSAQDRIVAVTGDLATSDIDVFEVELQEGDVFVVGVSDEDGFKFDATTQLLDSTGALVMESDGPGINISTTVHSPIVRGNAGSIVFVAPSNGTYFVRLQDATSAVDYRLLLSANRPALEELPLGTTQKIFLDFDGESLGPVEVSNIIIDSREIQPLANSLAAWGLDASDEDAVIDAIIAVVQADYDTVASINPNYDFEILNSRDHGDMWGQPNVSRVIIGAISDPLPAVSFGISTVDPGNFLTEETAIVQLNNFTNFINTTERHDSVSKTDLIGLAVGRVISHEAGHNLGGPHLEGFEIDPTTSLPLPFDIMEGIGGGGLANRVGLGPDGILGTLDDTTPAFGIGQPEGAFGTFDFRDALAWGMSQGKVPLADVGPAIANVTPDLGKTFDRDVTTLSVEFTEAVTALTAGDADNYELIFSGANGLFEGGSGDDQTIALTPSIINSTEVELTPAGGALSVGRYQLRLRGDSGPDQLLDSDGNPLNSLSGSAGGSDYIHVFEIAMEPGDLYEITLAAGEGLTLYTETPGDLGNNILQTLDPKIVILDSNGNPLASDANSAADGRNAVLDFIAPSAGTYLVQVQATSGAGEYVLNILRNEAPSVVVSGPTAGVRGQTLTYALTASDSSHFDQAADFTFDIDWDGDNVVDQTVVGPSGTQVTHVFRSEGDFDVKVTATDKLGGESTKDELEVDIDVWSLQADAIDPLKTNLVIGQTVGDDEVGILQTGANSVAVLQQRTDDSSPLVTFYPSGFDHKIIVFGQSGDDQIVVDADFIVQLYGDSGNDLLATATNVGSDLYGDDGDDILISLTSDDSLSGGSGRDVLVSGSGNDVLDGGDGEDLLISDDSDFHGSNAIIDAAEAVAAEWTSGHTFAQRVINISDSSNASGSRLNGSYFFTANDTIDDDANADSLTGGADDDWFFYSPADDAVSDASQDEEFHLLGSDDEFPPVIDPIANKSVDEGSLLTFTVTATDPDSDGLTYSLASGAPAGAAINSSGVFTWTPTDSSGTPFDVTVVVNSVPDGNPVGEVALSSEWTFSVTVNNLVPTVSISAPSTGVRGQSRTFTLTATDPSSIDAGDDFAFAIDWDGDSQVDQTVVGPSGTTVDHVFTTNQAFNVKVTATDKDGGISSVDTKTLTIKKWELQADPNNPSLMNLLYGGSDLIDDLEVVSFEETAADTIKLSYVVVGPSAEYTVQTITGVTGRIIGYGQAGIDRMLAATTNIAVELYGGHDDDFLLGGLADDYLDGGTANDILVGFDGADVLVGGINKDLLAGGDGSDSLSGGAGEDLLIADETIYDNVTDFFDSYTDIHDEWRSSRTLQDRIDNIEGTGSGGSNGTTYLTASTELLPDSLLDELFGDADPDWLFLEFGLDDDDSDTNDVKTDSDP